ncbi:MAG: chloride channel protein [Chitinophagaceae bacterium]
MKFYWYRRRLLIRFHALRRQYIGHRNFLIVVSFIIGLLSALAAVLLKLTVQFFERRAGSINDAMGSSWLTAIFPLIGTGVSLLILKYIFKGRLQRGVGFITESVVRGEGRIPKRHLLGHIFTSSITVATGGSVGLEAPIVATGAAVGSNTAQDLRLPSKDTVLLLACGAAGGIAAIFNSPIAGIVFTLEVLLLGFNIPFFIPLLISTATATVVSQLLYPEKFFFFVFTGWNIRAIPFYIVLGVCCGFISIYVSAIVNKAERFFHKRGFTWKTWLMGGIPLCVLVFVLPVLYGEGYHAITALLHGNYDVLVSHSMFSGMPRNTAIILACILLILVKAITATLTTGAGGNGGIFAPSMIIGGLTGFLFAFVINLTGIFPLNTPNFIIAAMAGVMAGVLHAPLTAIFLMAEITGGYILFVPLMIVAALSYFITRRYVRHSIYHQPLANKDLLPGDTLMYRDHF